MTWTTLYAFVFFFITSFYTSKVVCVNDKSHGNSKNNEDDESNWRVLGKDESVPRGSHVQLDLTTGERRIKIVDSETNKKSKTSVVLLKSNEEEKEKVTADDLNFRLHRVTGDDPKISNQEENKVKRKFKSYEELKKDFEDLRMAVKTDIEIMNGILESYKELVDDKVPITEDVQEQQITMLTDLEYLLHQIDNANEFVKNGGLANIVLPSLNSTSSGVRSGSARLLGSAAQSNVAVQIAALESGAIGMLLRILALDKTPSVRSSSLYALSCLVRRFPIAQKKLVDEGGLTVLNNLFNTEASDKLKIKVKVLTFIHDLIVEKQDAEKTFTLSKETSSNFSVAGIEEAKERLRQYNLIGLETKLQEQNWCEQLCQVLIEHVSLHLDVIIEDIGSDSLNGNSVVEHDVIEKVMHAMISSSNLCISDYENNKKLKELVRFLYAWYKKLKKADEDDDNYYSYLTEIIKKLTWTYKISLQEMIKDEL